MKRFIILICTILFSGISFAQNNCFENCWQNYKNSTLPYPARNDTILHELIGCKLPDFEALSLGGESFSSKELSGKVVVINFYFYFCPPCFAEVPALNKLVEEYKDKDVIFIAFSRDETSVAKSFVNETGFKYKVLTNIQNLESIFCILGGWPTNMVIDKNGVLRQQFSGGYTDERAKIDAYNKIKPTIDKYLNETK